MQRSMFVVSVLITFLALPYLGIETDAASDRTGIYARVDKVVLEPDTTTPERIQIWGAFALARTDDRNSYDSAQRGYLYFSCKSGKEDVCRKEWADLKAIAGTDKVIGFGGRGQPRPRVRKADEKAANPDEYPINFGLIRMENRGSDYPPIRELRSLPREKN
ncbi:MAG: hypothetical protein L0220_31765 [Acidobacteria bacterium]|nr:hypothetical protein [Acidobacteriota bacterium]